MLCVFLSLALFIPVPQPTAGIWHYQSRMEVDGKTIATVPMTREVVRERGLWVITETTRMPSGDVVESVELEPERFMLRKHSTMQGAIRTVSNHYRDGMVLVAVTIGAKTTHMDMRLHELWPSGAGLPVAIASLPLAEHYTTAFYVFERSPIKRAARQATVAAIEEITVPAGTFKAFKVEIRALEGKAGDETVWIAVDDRRVLKSVTAIPEANARTVNELIK